MNSSPRLWLLPLLLAFVLIPRPASHVAALSLDSVREGIESTITDMGRRQVATSRTAGQSSRERTSVLPRKAVRAQEGWAARVRAFFSGLSARVAFLFSGSTLQTAIISDVDGQTVSSRSTNTESVGTTTSTAAVAPAPLAPVVQQTVVQNPVVVKREVTSDVTAEAFNALRARISSLEEAGLAVESALARDKIGQSRYSNAELDTKFEQISNKVSANVFDVQSTSRNIAANSQAIALTNKIDQLKGITIINPEIQGTITMVAAGDAASSLSLSGNAAIGGTLSVIGTSTIVDLVSSGNGAFSGSLTVSGASTFATLVASGAIQASSTALFGQGFTSYASSTLQNFTAVNSTTTSATTTALHVSSKFTTLGNVGIGTTSPVDSLHIQDSAPAILLEDTSGIDGFKTAKIRNFGGIFSIGTMNNAFGEFAPDLLISQNTGLMAVGGTTTVFAALSVQQDAGEIGFAVGSSTASNFIIDAAGRVGIGTTSPFRRFTVGGDVGFLGDLLLPNLVATGTIQASSTALFGSGLISYASSTLQSITATAGRFLDVFQASSTALFGQGFVSYSSSTLQNLTGINATTTNATTTNLVASNQVYFTGLPTAGGATDVNITAEGQLFKVASSRRFKDNVATTSSITLDKISQLNVVDFDWNNLSLTPGTRDFGLIAEDTYNVLPELVGLDSSGNPISVSYSKLSVVALKAAQSLLNVIDISEAPTSTPSIGVTSSGVVTIGTTTSSSAHRLVVGGDIAATGFVNVSTEASKKDIDHLDSTEEASILDKITSLGVAKYHYKQEDSSEPLRLGLIAEEAPPEVLSADGKGVDIYKLVSFALAGIKAQQAKIEELTDRIGQTAGNAVASFRSLFAEEITTKRLCLEDLCVTKEQLRTLLDGNSAALTGTGDTSSPPDSIEEQSSSPPDTEPPVITLIGEALLEISRGSSWIDPGATVSDNVNTNLGIQVDGAVVDTSELGEHQVRYNATDAAGNRAVEVLRTVRIIEQ